MRDNHFKVFHTEQRQRAHQISVNSPLSDLFFKEPSHDLVYTIQPNRKVLVDDDRIDSPHTPDVLQLETRSWLSIVISFMEGTPLCAGFIIEHPLEVVGQLVDTLPDPLRAFQLCEEYLTITTILSTQIKILTLVLKDDQIVAIVEYSVEGLRIRFGWRLIIMKRSIEPLQLRGAYVSQSVVDIDFEGTAPVSQKIIMIFLGNLSLVLLPIVPQFLCCLFQRQLDVVVNAC